MKYISCISKYLTMYEKFAKASDCWSRDSFNKLRCFDRWLSDYDDISQDLVDMWCAKRETEKVNSCISRINPIISFLKYATERDLLNLNIPKIPKRQPRTYVPHAFSEDELQRFFHACDNLYNNNTNEKNKYRKITIPVFFRLLYSTGLRTTEARLLRREDVDLISGVINVRQSKGGHQQHYVVMHDSMKVLMHEFDTVMDKLMPNRVYFFQSKLGNHYHAQWVTASFSKIWKSCNDSKAVPYALRHHYATININKCLRDGLGFYSKFVYLSRTMGHRVLESTRYYYSLVPELAQIIDDLTGEAAKEIYPELTTEFDDENF